MVWPAIIGGGIAAAGAIGSAFIGASGGGDAKNMQKRLYKKSKKWRSGGKNALAEFMQMLKAGPGEFDPEEDPGYMYGYKNLVENPALRSASVRGRLFDPSTQKALGREASDYATTKYDNFLSRYYQKLSPYFQMSEAGRMATMGTGGQAAGLTGLGVSEDYGRKNAIMAGISGVTNIANKAIDYYGTQNILNSRNYKQPDWDYRAAVR